MGWEAAVKDKELASRGCEYQAIESWNDRTIESDWIVVS